MTDHVLYFWFCWILWVIVTFFMKKSRIRVYLAIWILLAIIFADYFIKWNHITVSVPFIFLFLGAAGLLAFFPRWLYLVASSFTVAIGYAAFLFWETISPVWLIMPRFMLITIIFGLLIGMLVKSYLAKIAVGLFGMAAGEFIFAWTLADYGLIVTLGDKPSLLSFFILVLFFIFLHILQLGKEKMNEKAEKYKEKTMEVVK